jgi:hypothetical protein
VTPAELFGLIRTGVFSPQCHLGTLLQVMFAGHFRLSQEMSGAASVRCGDDQP